MKTIRHVAPAPGSSTWVARGVKRTAPVSASATSASKVVPAHAVSSAPTAVGATANTPGSKPVHAASGPWAAHDGMTVMPPLPAGHGDESPSLHTVLVSSALPSVFVLRSSIVASMPVTPTVTVGGKLGTALAPTPACATPVNRALSASGATTQNARILTVMLRAPIDCSPASGMDFRRAKLS